MAGRSKGKDRIGNALPVTHRAFVPYATALGQLTLAWNELHQVLAVLFCSAMGGGVSNQFLAIWNALKMDRAQREVLRAAVKSNFMGLVPTDYVQDVDWLCARADAVEDARNDALHSPLWAQKHASGRAIVAPVIGLGHVRA